MLVLPLRDEADLQPQGGTAAAGLILAFVLSKCLGVDCWLLFGRRATGTAGAASAGCPFCAGGWGLLWPLLWRMWLAPLVRVGVGIVPDSLVCVYIMLLPSLGVLV